MRKFVFLSAALLLAGCQQNVVVPKTEDLMSNPQLLADWQKKCDSGEYSQLPADRKDSVCFTTREATRSIAMKKMYAQ